MTGTVCGLMKAVERPLKNRREKANTKCCAYVSDARIVFSVSLGRMAAHTGQELTMDDFMNSDHEFSPNTKDITSPDSPTPLQADETGAYAIPEPGIKKTREY